MAPAHHLQEATVGTVRAGVHPVDMPAAAGTMADMAGVEAGMVGVDREAGMAGVAMEAGMAGVDREADMAVAAMEVEDMRADMAPAGMGELLVAMAMVAARQVEVLPARIPMPSPTGILIGIRMEIPMVVPMACLHRRANLCRTISTKARSLNVRQLERK